MTVICVTGTPGCGKTFYAKKLVSDLENSGYKYIDVKEIIKENKLDAVFDKKKDCAVIDTKKLNSVLMKLKGNLVIDSHLSHYLPKEFVDYVVVIRCSNLKELKKRLEERKYSNEKVRENLDCEIFDVCLVEAMELSHKPFDVDSLESYVDFLNLIKK